MSTLVKGLYIVSTPIGNLNDITLRAIEVLKNSDLIICEDTRHSIKLLKHLKLKKKTSSFHKYNEKKELEKVIRALKEGKILSLISDAGTPSLSDPGMLLINECVKNNIKVFPIPGPSAIAAAVSICGFSDKFLFCGFFPDKKQDLSNELEKISKLENSLVYFVSPKKINKIIPEIKKNFSGRKIVFCREITKFYEEFIRKNIDELELFEKEPKGELTVVISEKKINKNISQKLSESDMNIIKKMIRKFSTKEITDIVSQITHLPKKEIYKYCLKLKNEK